MAATTVYKWSALHPTEVDAEGRRRFLTGEMRGDSEDIVRQTLENERGLIPVSVDLRKKMGGEKEWSIAKMMGVPSGKSMSEAYSQLASLVRVGIPQTAAVAAVAEGSKEVMVRETFAAVRDKTTSGYTLAEAMEDHPKVFGDTDVRLVSAAVEGGHVAETLDRIAISTRNKRETKKKIKSALMLPAITVVAAMGAAMMVAILMVPQMTLMLEKVDPDAVMPWATRVLVAFSDNAIIILPAIIAVLVVGYTLDRRVYVRNEKWLTLKSKVALKMPVMGAYTRLASLAALSRGMEMMIASGVRQSEALETLAPTLPNRVYRVAVAELSRATLEGRPLSKVMQAHEDLFDFTFIAAMKTGETSGTLDMMFASIADEKERELAAMVDTMAELLNPVALVLIGAMIGVVGVGMYGPVMAISQSM